MNTITESITFDEDTNTLSVKLRPVFEHLRQIKLHKKQQFTESLENLTGTLETRSQSAKEALQNNTLDLTKITMIGTRQRRLNTKIEPNFDGSKKVNVGEGTRTLKVSHMNLNHARLPIPPLRLRFDYYNK